MKEATRPKEILYFFHVQVATDQGTTYIFNVMDDYSEYVIDLGASTSLDEDAVIANIKKLLKHKDFKRSPKKPFTLLSAIGGDFQDRIKSILLPEKGKLIIDPQTVKEHTKAFTQFFSRRA